MKSSAQSGDAHQFWHEWMLYKGHIFIRSVMGNKEGPHSIFNGFYRRWSHEINPDRGYGGSLHQPSLDFSDLEEKLRIRIA